jgi:hypothetical protein
MMSNVSRAGQVLSNTAHPRLHRAQRSACQQRRCARLRASAAATALPVLDKLHLWLVKERGLPGQKVEVQEVQDPQLGPVAACKATADIRQGEVRTQSCMKGVRMLVRM